MRIMDSLALYFAKLRHPLPDIFSLSIELLTLQDWIEDPLKNLIVSLTLSNGSTHQSMSSSTEQLTK